MIDETQTTDDRLPDPPEEIISASPDETVHQSDSHLSGGNGSPEEISAESSAADAVAESQSIADSDTVDASSVDSTVDEEDEEDVDMDVAPLEDLTETSDDEISMDWYILKVQSNREESILDALRRRVAIEGLDRYFGEIIVPTEEVAEFKNGKKRITKRKLFPGYIVVHMSINDDTWFLVRETPGIGDFTGSAGRPSPMLAHEVERVVQSTKPEEDGGEPIKTVIPFSIADRVRIKEGTFENFEGDVDGIDEANGLVTVMINIFGRSTPVELEHWQIEAV